MANPDDLAGLLKSDRLPKAQVTGAGAPGNSELLPLMVGVVVVSGLYFGREILVPITLAILLSFLLAPIVSLLRRLHLGRTPAVLLAVLLALGIILAVGGVVGMQVGQLAGNFPTYASTVETKISKLRSDTLAPLTRRIDALGKQLERAAPAPPAAPDRASAPQPAADAPQKPMPVEIHERSPSPLDLATRYLSPVLSPLATMGIVFIVAIFILLQQEDLRNRLIRLFGSDDLHQTTMALDDGAKRLSRYFLIQLGINTAFGVIIGAGLLFIGLPNPMLWGILAMLMRFVPYIGTIISGALPVALAAAVDPGWSMALWTVALFLVTEPIVGQVIEPVAYGRSTGMSPISVILAAIFWSWLWGPIGLILSTPITLCLVVLGRHVKRFEFFDVLLGDQPPLSAVERFYQRLLAGDTDEILEQAEACVRVKPLADYYDDVVVPGLRMAAEDVARGVLEGARLERVRATIGSVVDDLATVEEDTKRQKSADPAPPPKPGSRATVLCVPGRGALDDAASLMLVQLLERHGFDVRSVPHDAVSRARIGTLTIDNVAMVCVTYLDLSGTPANARYLLQRLRRQFNGAGVMLGLWPEEAPVLHDERLRAALAADHYTLTMRQAIDACIQAGPRLLAPPIAAPAVPDSDRPDSVRTDGTQAKGERDWRPAPSSATVEPMPSIQPQPTGS